MSLFTTQNQDIFTTQKQRKLVACCGEISSAEETDEFSHEIGRKILETTSYKNYFTINKMTFYEILKIGTILWNWIDEFSHEIWRELGQYFGILAF